MARQLAWAFAVLLLLPAPGRAANVCEKTPGGQPPQQQQQREKSDKKPEQSDRRKWWIDKKDRAELEISDQQSATIEAIWRKSLKERAATRDRLEQLEAALSRMMLDPAVDETAVAAQIDKVEAARTEANKARVLMLFRMNRVLNPDQRQKLDAKAKAMREQRDGGRRGGSPR